MDKTYLFTELFTPEKFEFDSTVKTVEKIEKVYDDKGRFIEEKKKQIKEYFTVGPTVLTDEINQNNRIYDGQDMDRALREYKEKFIDSCRAYGELDHPFDEEQSLYVELKNSSHLFTEYRREGNYIYSKAKIMDTPNGGIAKAIIDAGGKLGISTRGIGDIEERNGKPIVINYEFITMGDYVHDPSAPGALLDVLKEGKMLLKKDYHLREKDIEKIEKEERNFDSKYRINLSSDEKRKLMNEFFESVVISLRN